ncbi:MAG: hypothetical protein ACYCPO_06865 [Acidobacteriaceae bacterium]
MWKRLAIVVLLAGILPIYGQQQGPKSDGDQSSSDGAKNPASQPSRVITCEIKHDGTSIECNWPQAVSEGYFKRLFSPEDAPNIALVVVGIGGILAALCTLRVVKEQVNVMKIQTGILAESVAAATESANAANAQIRMVKDKERARISVKPLDFHGFKAGYTDDHAIWLNIENFGFTQALNVRATCDAFPIVDDIPPEVIEGNDLLVPDVIRPAVEPEKAVTLFFFGRDEIKRLNPQTPNLVLRIVGSIGYDDVFSEHHITAFQYSLKIASLGNFDFLNNQIPVVAPIEWQKTGPLEANQAT